MIPKSWLYRWLLVGVDSEGGRLRVRGLNPWKYEWRRLSDERIELPHPRFKEDKLRYHVYEIKKRRKTVVFAATEVSNGIWAFYVRRMW